MSQDLINPKKDHQEESIIKVLIMDYLHFIKIIMLQMIKEFLLQ